ncbi:DMT family transporter [Terriglobus sp. ADX1]
MTTTATHSAFLTGLVVVIVPILCLIPALRPQSEAPTNEGRPTSEARTAESRHPERSAAQSKDLHSSPSPQNPWKATTPLLGACGAFVGIVLLTTPANLPVSEFTHGFRIGDVLSLLCAIAFSAHLLSLAHLAKKIPTSQLATLQIGFAALILAIATPIVEHPHLHLTRYLVFAILLCSFIATAAAFYIQSWAQQHLAASHTALLLALEPAFALLTALLFFGERLTLRSGLGAALILCSLIASELLSSQPVSEQPEANAA